MNIQDLKCVICGTYDQLTAYTIKDTKLSGGRRTYVFNTTSFGDVPLCTSCRKKVEKYVSISRIANVIGILSCGSIFILAVIIALFGGFYGSLIILLIPVTVMAVIQILAISLGTNIGKYVKIKERRIYIVNRSDHTKQTYISWKNSVFSERHGPAIKEDWDRAVSRKILDDDTTEDAQKFFQKGRKLSKDGEFGPALEAFNMALEFSPNYARALSEKGAILIELERFDEAFEVLNRALEIRPHLTSASQRLNKLKIRIDK